MKLPFMPWGVRDWLSSGSVARLRRVERSIYFDLLCRMWDEDMMLADDDAGVALLLGLGVGTWRKARARLLDVGVVRSAGGLLVNDKLTAVYADSLSRHEDNQNRARRAAQARYGNAPSNAPSNAQAMREDCQAEAEAEAEAETDQLQKQKQAQSREKASAPAPTALPENASELVRWLASTWPDIRDPTALEASAIPAYPAVDLLAEARKAAAWEAANGKRRKHDHARFLGNWWARAQDRGNGHGQDLTTGSVIPRDRDRTPPPGVAVDANGGWSRRVK